MKIILGSAFFFAALATAFVPSYTVYEAPTVYASTPPIMSVAPLESVPLSASSTADLVKYAEARYGLTDTFYNTISCESAHFQDIQSYIKNENGPNGRENSWGIAQINLTAHPDVTRSQALDIPWAIDYAAKQFEAGNERMFVCYRILYEGYVVN